MANTIMPRRNSVLCSVSVAGKTELQMKCIYITTTYRNQPCVSAATKSAGQTSQEPRPVPGIAFALTAYRAA